ncbi:MAG: hypothetical protein R3C26_26625 [Calditrichia bacterium]
MAILQSHRKSAAAPFRAVSGWRRITPRDLLPLMMVIAKEGRIEEEMFLTTFLWEEPNTLSFSGDFWT